MRQFYVKYKDGSKDWIDPVLTFKETEDQFIVGNGYYDYTIDKVVVDTWEFLELEE